ncbi:MAG: hypothetical protein JOY89_21840 [Solirubrobacterales bacterium]|nr:hypothetical protein [Solirubrobacterales bacterium]
MAPKSNSIIDSVEAATERVADIHEKSVATSKKASEAYMSSYEKAVVALVDTYEKAATATKVDWVASIASLQADASRELTRAYTSTVRELVPEMFGMAAAS